MAAPRKKGKKKPGGDTGRPVMSEPRVQMFNKFSGCNFQLAMRNFDDIFDTDFDAQTDLMPMFMTVQNNASVVPMGGIETRDNIVSLMRAPEEKKLTGVVTLIGDRLYAACDDMTVHHGSIVDGTLDDQVEITDLNNTYGGAQTYSYSGTVD